MYSLKDMLNLRDQFIFVAKVFQQVGVMLQDDFNDFHFYPNENGLRFYFLHVFVTYYSSCSSAPHPIETLSFTCRKVTDFDENLD